MITINETMPARLQFQKGSIGDSEAGTLFRDRSNNIWLAVERPDSCEPYLLSLQDDCERLEVKQQSLIELIHWPMTRADDVSILLKNGA